MAATNRQVAIVLQGGGALGAYELGVLQRLYEQEDFHPAVVSGVSIGAITAAALVGAKSGDPIKTLEAMWEEFEVFSSPLVPDSLESMLSVLGNPAFYLPRGDFFQFARWTSLYRLDPLKATVNRHVSFERIANSDIHLILTATNVETGKVETFDNRARGPLEMAQVMASASLPPGFPMTAFGGHSYWDGGLFENTPLTPVIQALDPASDPQLVIVNLFPARGQLPRNLPEVFDRMLQILFANRTQDNVELTLEVSEYVELANAIKAHAKLANAVKNLAGFQRLERYKLLQNIVYVTNQDEEPATAFFDFSRATLQRRIASGYRDAGLALAKPLRRAADMAAAKQR